MRSGCCASTCSHGSPSRRHALDTLRAIAIDNKRFTDGEWSALRRALHGPRTEGGLVNWDGMAFRDQLRLLSKTQIHMSGGGTACTNQPFMPDGAVHINLGACRHFTFTESVYYGVFYPGYRDPLPGYMEQSMAVSTPYHRALYYPLDEVCKGLTVRRLHALIQQAVALIDDSFPIPVPRGTNLAPSGRLLQELLRRDPQFREYISDPVAHKPFSTGTYFWLEIILHPAGPWGPGGECKLNRTLLEELKAEL